MKRSALIIAAASLLGGAVVAPNTATAMARCGERDQVVASLTDRHAERHIASGFQSEAGLMEIWASDSDNSWAITQVTPSGRVSRIVHE
ncbi:MAG: hypothetical protein AAFY06_12255, partial [Pseudomonadota bacterium]